MIEFVKLTAEHILMIGQDNISADVAVALEDLDGWAAIDRGEVVAAGGFMPLWSGNALAWAWMTRNWRRNAKTITLFAADQIANAPYKRVEAGVRYGFYDGYNWARTLGFEMETPCAQAWGPDGDYAIFVRVKEDG